MDITSPIPKNKNSISSYGPEGFQVNEEFHKNSIILSPNKLFESKVNIIEEVQADFIVKFLSQKDEILLIGTGSKHKIISADLKQQIKNSYPNISINEMSSHAVCRTYNILISEDRNVVAIIMPINL